MNGQSAIVIGSGPNGLAAAIELARNGVTVEVREAAETPGGAARSGALTLPGFVHDLGSAVHPMALASPFFKSLWLEQYGIEWRWSPAELAHPLDDGTAVLLSRSVAETAEELGGDGRAYRKLFDPIVRNWDRIIADVLRPVLHFPQHPLALAPFGLRAVQPASILARSWFRDTRARALFAGIAAHSVMKLSAPLTSAFACMLGGAAHAVGWPMPVGGAQKITDALLAVLGSYGGRVQTRGRVNTFEEVEAADVQLFDLTPRQLLPIAGKRFSPRYAGLLAKYIYGPGIFKVDWALNAPIPWKAAECGQAITVHLGGTLEEIEKSESDAWNGRAPERPFVLLAQPSLFDPSRAPEGKHTAWAYCHVPNGWTGSASEQIEAQVERFAPGFRECILARAAHSTQALEAWDGNLVGGDISGGASTVKQFVFRPTRRQYRTSMKGVYLCSSATPPGGGVHGMCGYNAARTVLEDLAR